MVCAVLQTMSSERWMSRNSERDLSPSRWTSQSRDDDFRRRRYHVDVDDDYKSAFEDFECLSPKSSRKRIGRMLNR